MPIDIWRQAVLELQFDQADQQRVDGSPSGEQLLRHRSEGLLVGEEMNERADLPIDATGMTDERGPVRVAQGRRHGVTKTAPVIPAAAWPGRVQMKLCVPGSVNVRVIVRVSPGSRIDSTPSRPGM